MNTPNIFDRLSRKIHHHSDMEPHESDSGPPFGEVEPLNLVHWPMNWLTVFTWKPTVILTVRK